MSLNYWNIVVVISQFMQWIRSQAWSEIKFSISGQPTYEAPGRTDIGSTYQIHIIWLSVCWIVLAADSEGPDQPHFLLAWHKWNTSKWCKPWKNRPVCTPAQSNPLRKHTYSNILKISPPKTESFQIKFWYFSYFCSKHRLSVLVRTASPRRFKRVPTIYIFKQI